MGKAAQESPDPSGAALLAAWRASCARLGARGDIDGAGAQLVAAYRDPSRAYHDARHLAEVLANLDALTGPAGDDVVRLAAWFHDAVYDAAPDTGSGASNEERSATTAVQVLSALGLAPQVVAEVARLVRLTATHDPADDDAGGALLCDADLAVLAREPAEYAQYVTDVRREYAAFSDADFAAGRAAVLRSLLAQPFLFRTPLGRALWECKARANVERELTSGSPQPRDV